MIFLDLQRPMDLAGVVHRTERHPLQELQALADPARAVMLAYNDDWTHHIFTCLHYNPATGEVGFSDGDTPEAAFQGAQSAFLEAGGRLLAVH